MLDLHSSGIVGIAARIEHLGRDAQLHVDTLVQQRGRATADALAQATSVGQRDPDSPRAAAPHMADLYHAVPISPSIVEVVNPSPQTRIRFKGGTITAKTKPYLVFKVNGAWVRVRQVTQQPTQRLVVALDAEEVQTRLAFRQIGQRVFLTDLR